MNKNLIIGIVALLLIGGGAYYFLSQNKQAGPTSGQSTTSSGPSGSVFSSIRDALSKSLSLACTFTDESGRQTKSYIKNGAVRADITAADSKESGSVIVKDNKMYFWNSQGGFMMDLTTTTTPGAGSATTGSSGTSAPGEVGNVMDTLEKYKNSCKPSVVADSLFTPPTNVTFQDFSKMMQPPTGSASTNAIPTINYQQYRQGNPQVTPSGY